MDEKCNATTVECPTGKCYSATATLKISQDKPFFIKGCTEMQYCKNAGDICKMVLNRFPILESCNGTCCDSDYCNKAGNDIQATKANSILCLMAIISGYFLAWLGDFLILAVE